MSNEMIYNKAFWARTTLDFLQKYLQENQSFIQNEKTCNLFLEKVTIPLLRELQIALGKSDGSIKKYGLLCEKIMSKNRQEIKEFILPLDTETSFSLKENIVRAQDIAIAIIKESISLKFMNENLKEIRKVAYQLIDENLLDLIDRFQILEEK